MLDVSLDCFDRLADIVISMIIHIYNIKLE